MGTPAQPSKEAVEVGKEIAQTETEIAKVEEKIADADSSAELKQLNAHMATLLDKVDKLSTRLEALEGKADEPVVNAPPIKAETAPVVAEAATAPEGETVKPAKRRLGGW